MSPAPATESRNTAELAGGVGIGAEQLIAVHENDSDPANPHQCHEDAVERVVEPVTHNRRYCEQEEAATDDYLGHVIHEESIHTHTYLTEI